MIRKNKMPNIRKTILALAIIIILTFGLWWVYANGYIQADITSTSGIFDKIARDNVRKKDLQTLKSAIDGYYTIKAEFPPTDGWIATYDVNKGITNLVNFSQEGLTFSRCVQKYGRERCPSNEALAETLLPLDLIDKFPCDPNLSVAICAKTENVGYMYYRDDYCGGSKEIYGLYAKLESPTQADLDSIGANSTSKCDVAGKGPQENGMNYKLGGTIENLSLSTPGSATPQLSYPHMSDRIINLNGKIALIYSVSDLPAEFKDLLKVNLKKGWNTIALPVLAQTKNKNKSFLNGLPNYKGKQYAYKWLNSWNLVSKDTENYFGAGYIVYSPEDKTILLDNIAQVVFLETQNNPYEITLQKSSGVSGPWNLVGNPFFKNTNVFNWIVEYKGQKLKFENAAGWIHNSYKDQRGVVVAQGGSAYKIVNEVKIGQGFWIATKFDGVKIIIP
ncbi:MAG: hypothetical protein CEN89_758 [Candidatus Berkelbacteria bacterium Licking1014_7]|uniref:Uncharacterized protein n=1 Tax=Candidatus Berkelbacteria bacterium Licking1014_7 TaxID=2017147 RepID=A0A554LHI1_9BACT|nr:MAG: hypothetical protein CEN89_758 [Candidatus Berkelbacteria bacterium Licking1014_7]